MFVQRIRQQGDDLWLAIPSGEIERLSIQDGDLVAVSVDRVRARMQVFADVRMVTEAVMREFKVDLDYLKDR